MMQASTPTIFVDAPYDTDWDFPEPVPETEPQRQEDLWRYRFPWVKTAVAASPYDDSLLVENHTAHLWMLWHRYHALGSIAPGREDSFHLVKSGLLTARQYPPPPHAEHILLELAPAISAVAIVDLSGSEGFYALQVLDLLPREGEQAAVPSPPITRMIEELGLSAKIEHALERQGITTVDQLTSMGLSEVASLKGLGPRQRKELLERLIELDFV